MRALLLLGLLALQAPERIADIQVHGNTLTTDADIIAIAGLAVGMPVEAQTFADAAARLRAAHKFEKVEVLKRYASIADPSQIAVVIVVDEGPVKIDLTTEDGKTVARVRKTRNLLPMFAPVLRYDDGYGFTYGVQLAKVGGTGARSRLSFPLTWGGEKRAGAQFDTSLNSGPLSRVHVGADIVRRENPFFEADDDRGRVMARVERDVTRSLRIGGSADWNQVHFLGQTDQFVRAGGDAVFDTRIDPMLSRNAVYGRVAWDHLDFEHEADANRMEFEGRGYLGLPGQAIAVVRALRQDSTEPLPPYLKPLLGGTANLRGFRAGSAIGDTLVSTSLELRVPLNSPLNLAKVGASGFIDAATVYPKGERLRDQSFERGVGGGVWMSVAVLRLNLYVAHAVGGSTRVHFGMSVEF